MMGFRTLGCATLAVLIGCGGKDGPAPDAAPPAATLTIHLYDTAPYTAGPTSPADLVAVQLDDGDWQKLAGDDKGAYQVPLARRYSVLVACVGSPDTTTARVYDRTADDGVRLDVPSCYTPPGPTGTGIVTVQVQNVPAGGVAVVAGPGGVRQLTALPSTSLDLELARGQSEVVAWLETSSLVISKIVRVPPFTLDAAHSVTIDFATQGAAPDRLPLTVRPGPALYTVETVVTPLGSYELAQPLSPTTYLALPAALRLPGDRSRVTVFGGLRDVTVTSASPGPLVVDLPPELAAVGFGAPGAAPRPEWSLGALPPTGTTLTLSVETRTRDQLRAWAIQPSASWLAFAPSLLFDLPDAGPALAGLHADLGLLARTKVTWAAAAVSTATGADGAEVILRSAFAGDTGHYCGNHAIEPPETCDPPDGTTCSADCTAM